MSKEIVSFNLFSDLYNHFTLAMEKIKKLSEMTCDNDAVVIMDIVEDIMTAEHEKICEIWEEAKKQRITA